MKNWNLRKESQKKRRGTRDKARFEYNIEKFSKMMKDINVQI